ncbi:hypothetical protein NDR87_30910 [Nocardia sp. CDC159]|uniref:Scaffolding protein n=1 Tax=Nocardia pulmonis TaxID=2951408 RepID=A0A9X2ECN0_9NOCA|nr:MULTISPECIES: hypothetical protein [Nocardia]MCM6778039.1 hypothetical protein [Nocardia pulmonis]MCM6790790.1 hypothetical protein [Nocardia sp. CDC159]
MTAPATGTAPAEPGTTEPTTAPQAPVTPAAEPATGTTDGELGDAGKAAIQKERDARKAAEKARREAEAELQRIKDANKSEDERRADRIAQLEKDAAKALRYEAAEKAELPLALAARLKGETLDEMIADAQELKQLLGVTATTPAAPPTPKPDPRQGGGQADVGGSMAAGRAYYEARKNRT